MSSLSRLCSRRVASLILLSIRLSLSRPSCARFTYTAFSSSSWSVVMLSSDDLTIETGVLSSWANRLAILSRYWLYWCSFSTIVAKLRARSPSSSGISNEGNLSFTLPRVSIACSSWFLSVFSREVCNQIITRQKINPSTNNKTNWTNISCLTRSM